MYIDEETINLSKNQTKVPALSPPSTGIAKLIQETKTSKVEGM
jgi:hypothetical protein